MLELACREVVFHFNKHHLVDPATPMWVLKTKGKTYMVDHVTASIPWSTKETPDNSHTKGAIKFKNALVQIDDNNNAELLPLTIKDIARLKTQQYTRILISAIRTVPDYLKSANIAHTKLKIIYGACGSGPWYICDIKRPNDMVMLKLAMPAGSFRELQENEAYYKRYDLLDEAEIDEDDEDHFEELEVDDDDDDEDLDETE